MKKRILLVVLSMFLLTGCTGERISSPVNELTTEYQILLNSGSCFIYTFKDAKTGVWYISTSEGVYPRLNLDGSLYKGE